jgi:hypothetical protein
MHIAHSNLPDPEDDKGKRRPKPIGRKESERIWVARQRQKDYEKVLKNMLTG